MKRLLPLYLVMLLAACTGPLEATPAPTQEAIYITYPSALQPWASRLADCADGNPGVGMYYSVSNFLPAAIKSNEIVLSLGQPDQPSQGTFLSQVGQEQITVVVNGKNPIQELSNEQLRAIFSGQVTSWANGSGQPVTVWVLPESDPIHKVFNQSVMQFQPVTTNAMLAPDEVAMMEAVSKDTNAIGYLPGSYLNSSGSVDPGELNAIQVQPSLESAMNQPVIAITQGEPQGNIRSLVVCLEASTP